MERDLTRLAGTAHDVVVVGGGIHGACIAWDAALRGLRVALLERGDFGAATSAASLRIVHGGLRYLARGDLHRMRESIRERSAFLRIAPTLVEPLPVMLPTTGAGTQGRAAFRAALALNDLLSLDRNRGLETSRRLPPGRLLSREACRRLFPAFPLSDASGGALWHDARLVHPERLTLAFVRAAALHGAAVANHCRMDRVVSEAGRVRGVIATDLEGGAGFEVRGRAVVLAAGPWTPELAGGGRAGPQAFALNVELGRRLAEAAVGVRAPTGPADDPIIGGRRFIFLVPRGETTLLGTWYAAADDGEPRELVARGTAALLAELRGACPAVQLTAADVVRCHWGRLPLKAGREAGRSNALAERPSVTEHGAAGGIQGMFSVEGVKYTTARAVAEHVVDRIAAELGAGVAPCATARVRVDEGLGDLAAPLESRVRQAVRSEMALRLSDVVLRRTTLGIPPGPTRKQVGAAARLVAGELGWAPAREEAEIEEVMRQLRGSGSTMEPAA
jgi:glycerol-3-phosphate dehydrogenase